MFLNKLDDVFIRYASDVLADTNLGLTGSEIVKYCNSYAIDFGVNIPITSSNFGSFGSIVPNKRMALYSNLVEFNGEQQFKIIKELSELEKFSGNEAVHKLKTQLYERFQRFNTLSNQNISSSINAHDTINEDTVLSAVKVLIDIYNNDKNGDIYLTDGDPRISFINDYEKVLNRLRNQGFFTVFKTDIVGGYEIELSEKAFTYFVASNKEGPVSEERMSSVFISYNWGNCDYVDEIETALAGKCNIKRDKNNIGAWESITDFMKTIRKEDFALLIISDAYLKSIACLFEVVQLMKDDGWDRKTMYIVMDDATAIYSSLDRISYIKYWNNYCESLSSAIKELPPATVYEQSKELQKAETIKNNIGEFLVKVSDSNNPTIDTAIPKIEERLKLVK